MTDTLQIVTETTQKISDSNAIDLIDKVNSFYHTAWDKLIIVGTVSFAVIGIIVPLIIQWYQKRTLAISESLLKKNIENQILLLKADILEDINKTIADKVQEFENSITKLNAASNARTLHLQGNTALNNNKNVNRALSDYILAAENYLKCEDYPNLQTMLRLIEKECIPKLSLEEIDDIKIANNSDLERLFENVQQADDKNMFTQTIRNIRLQINKLPKTIREKT